MKLSNVIAFTDRMNYLVAESDIFTRCFFIADDDTMCLRVTATYRETYANGGVTMYGDVSEDVSYEEFNNVEFDSMTLGDEVFLKLKNQIKTNIF